MPVGNTRAALAALALASAAAIACERPPRLAADLVVTDAKVWTGNSAQPSAGAVAVIGDRIVDVGGADDIDRWRGPNTTVLNADGRRLIPGVNDACVRFVDGGVQLDEVDLAGAPTAAEFARRINERAKAKPGEWILGGRWDERPWTPPALPIRALIDDITNSSPVFVVRYDGSMGLANAAALGRAGITERTPDPPGGAIVRDARGFPTGLLQGTAMQAVAGVIPKVTPEQRLRAIKRALEHAESLGVTSVHDIGASYDDIGAYADLANRGELTVRIYAVPEESGWYDQAKLGVHRAFGSAWLRIGAVRAAIDPSADGRELRTRLMAADHAGLQLSVSAADGGAATPVLDLLDAIARANGGRDRRFRVDGTRIGDRDLARLTALDAIAPLGSGWPDAPLNPMLTLGAAAQRGLSVAEGLTASTRGAAFAEFQERDKGTIARGQLADMIVLSDDVLALPAAAIKGVRVLTTIVGGTIVHQRKP
ncbi:MAG: Amidohydrolase 3 [Acidobacteria bacterium]|nr:Amidohydrolase 3 [Acidobacteriota bacterium]